MRWCPRTPPRYWLFFLSVFIAGCASAPHIPDSRFGPDYLISRNGLLHYKLPVGWRNLTGDSTSSSTTIWLVRNDFSATLAVREVMIDAGTRNDVNNRGLKRIAELMLALASGEGQVHIVIPPALSSLRGTEICIYEYITGQPGDRAHVILLDTHTSVYEVSMLMTKKIPDGSIADVIALQQSFVENLAW